MNFPRNDLRGTFINIINAIGALESPKARLAIHNDHSYFEGRSLFISFLYLDLVIATPQIDFGEDGKSIKLIKHVIKSMDVVLILEVIF